MDGAGHEHVIYPAAQDQPVVQTHPPYYELPRIDAQKYDDRQ